ncbi:MAG: caspase domain-containing protein [Terracidiphilus sp.]
MLKRSSHPSTRGLVRILTIASLIALLIVLAGEHHSAPVRAGFQVIGDVPRTGILHVLSIGINAYPKDSNIMNLHFAVADAQGVADAFSTKDVGNAFIKVDVKTLFDSDATVSGIRSALEHLIEVCKPEDVVIFYFAGMGARQKTNPETRTTSKASPDYNFIAFDSSVPSGSDISTASNSFTAHELSLLLLSIQAQRQIVIIDSSDSTAAFDSLSAALNADSVFTLRDTGRRFALFGTEGSGYEVPQLNHGLMTYTLLEAMKGGADTDHKGYITEADLEGFMMAHMGYMIIKQERDRSAYQLSEQLLSYSDLRGLCLATATRSPRCKTDYGYDPKANVKQETRGQGPREPSTARQPADRGTDYALILAGDTYDHWKRLNNPIYDAQTLRQELIQNFGYAGENILYRENPTKRDIHNLLTDLQNRKFGDNDRLLVYVAGHGHMDDGGDGFLVTRETLLPAEDPDLNTLLALSLFRDKINGLPVHHILLVLDVCYGGSFKDHKSSPEYTSESLDTPPSLDAMIANKMKSVSRLYIASGGLRQAFDGQPGRHSPFARTFLKTLEKYGGSEHMIDMGKLDGAVYGLCPHPYFGTFGIQQEGGDFIFIPKPDAHPVPDPGLEAKVEGPHCSS